MAYKSRRARRMGGKTTAAPEHIAAFLAPRKAKPKAVVDPVEGMQAMGHLGRRARGGQVMKRAAGGQTEADRDKALADYRGTRKDRKDLPAFIKQDDDKQAADKFKVDGGDGGLQRYKHSFADIPRYEEPEATGVDVDQAADKYRRSRGDFAKRMGARAGPDWDAAGKGMDTNAGAPGTKDSGEMATLPRKRDASTESIDDEYPEEIELKRGGRASKPHGIK